MVQAPQALFGQAMDDFEMGRIAESVVLFDRLAAASPRSAPELWQRGIALYFAGRFADCRAQFESHRTVNPDDVENAAWHFSCVARAESVDRARAALLPVGPDARRPMREVYALLQGAASPDQVLAAAGRDTQATFYAHLYLGLYHEALRQDAAALEHIEAAAADRYAAVGGYMHMVARVHLGLLQQAGAARGK